MTIRDAVITVRVTPALKKKIEQLAQQNHRKVSDWVYLALQECLEDGKISNEHGSHTGIRKK